MNDLPAHIGLVFGLTTGFTVFMFFRAARNSTAVLLALLAWLMLLSLIALSGLLLNTSEIPPRMLLVIGPPLLTILLLFVSQRGRRFLDILDEETLTLIHSCRIFVEVVLLWLYFQGTVPMLMTFEGRNWDIFSGLTAPLLHHFVFVKKMVGKKLLLTWNFICLGLLLNIVINGILSAPSPFQKFAFDHPNIALLHFPFVWLPGCIVPIVLLSHLTMIRKLVKTKT